MSLPKYTYNAFPVALKDIQEIYEQIKEYIENCNKTDCLFSSIKIDCLSCENKTNCSFSYNNTNSSFSINYTNCSSYNMNEKFDEYQLQNALLLVSLNNYSREISPIDYSHFTNTEPMYNQYDKPLYCIETPVFLNYTNITYEEGIPLPTPYINFLETYITLEKLFPNFTKYENFSYADLPKYSVDLISILEEPEKIVDDLETVEKELEELTKQTFQKRNETKKLIEKNKKIEDEIKKCEKENKKLAAQNKKIKKCINRLTGGKDDIKRLKTLLDESDRIFDKKFQQLEKEEKKFKNGNFKTSHYLEEIKKYKLENEKERKEIEEMENKNERIKTIVEAEFGIIVILLIFFLALYFLKKNNRHNNFKEVRNFSNGDQSAEEIK